MGARFLRAFCLCALAWAGQAHAQAKTEDGHDKSPTASAEAPHLGYVRQALEEYDRGHYPEALVLFERARAVSESARVLRGIALVLFELEEYVRTVETIDVALVTTSDPLSDPFKDQLRDVRARAEHFIGTVQFRVTPSHARIRVDGVLLESAAIEPVRLDMGSHTLEVEAAGRLPERRAFDVAAGKAQTFEIVLQAPQLTVHEPQQKPATRAVRRLTAMLAGTAVLGVASLTYAGFSLQALHHCVQGEEGGATCTSQGRLRRLAITSLSVGVFASVGAGVCLWQLSHAREERRIAQRSAGLTCAVDGQGFGCSARTSW